MNRLSGINKLNISKLLITGILLNIFTFSFAQSNDTIASDSINLAENIAPRGDIREKHPIETANDLVNKDFLGSWPMFGTGLRMKIGGYVKADFVYDINGTRDRSQFLMSTIPVEGEPDYGGNGYLSFFAKETRFNIDIRALDGKIPVRAFVEGDFFGTGSNPFRLRHAYIAAGNFTIGQYWTTLTFLESLPFLIDFAAGDALFGGRTVQIRYKHEFSEKFAISAGIEQLPSQGIQNPNDLAGEASAQLPLLALKGEFRSKNTAVFFGASGAQLRWDGGPNEPAPTAFQFNFVLAGRQYLGERNYFTWNFSYGEGSGENILSFIGSDANAVLTNQVNLKTMRATSALVGFNHKWTEALSSNFSYAYGWLIDIPEEREPFSLKDGGIGHFNFVWQINKYLSTGVEYMWGAQRTSNEAFGSANRIQFMTKFDF
jgi:hypothetical protein